MNRLIAKILVTSLTVLLIAYILPGVRKVEILDAIIFSLLLAFLNAFLRPLLVLLTIPVTLVTFGLFLLVINTFIIIIADYLLEDFYISNFWWALLFSLILSIVNPAMDRLFGLHRDERE